MEHNSQASLIDLGYPGTLPVVNEEAIEMALKLGIALDGDIPEQTVFARKKLFLSRFTQRLSDQSIREPIISGGFLKIEVNGKEKNKFDKAHLRKTLVSHSSSERRIDRIRFKQSGNATH